MRVEGDFGIIGITFSAQKELGDIVYVRIFPSRDLRSKARRSAPVESVKAVSDLYTGLGRGGGSQSAAGGVSEILNTDPTAPDGLLRSNCRTQAKRASC